MNIEDAIRIIKGLDTSNSEEDVYKRQFEKFGEFDSYGEINRAAKAQLEEGDLEAIRTITEENGLDPEDAEDFCTGAIEELTTPIRAAIGKLELEAKDLKLEGALKDWTLSLIHI